MTLKEKQKKYQHYHLEKYEYLTCEKILLSNEREIIAQTKFTCSPLRKVFEKQTKMIEEQGRKKIDAITNQNERLAALTNRGDNKDIYKEIFDKLVKEKFDKIKDVTYEINDHYLTCYFKGDSAKTFLMISIMA